MNINFDLLAAAVDEGRVGGCSCTSRAQCPLRWGMEGKEDARLMTPSGECVACPMAAHTAAGARPPITMGVVNAGDDITGTLRDNFMVMVTVTNSCVQYPLVEECS